MKQTAVDWLIEELVNQKLVKIDKLSTYYWYKNYATHFELLCENARQKEKQQMIDFTDNYLDSCVVPNENMAIPTIMDVPQYYKETYGKQ